jgi:Fibrobacter succinogenes major domain (Fib_succ_major).
MNRVKSSMSKCLLFSVMALFGCTDVPDELRNEAEGKCNGRAYTEYQFCANGQVYNLCGGLPFNPSIVDCCNNHQYTISTEFCSQNNIYRKCGGRDYDPITQSCQNDAIQSRCGANLYNSSTQFCDDNKIIYDLCGGRRYSTQSQKCQNGVVMGKCGTETNWYNTSTQFCFHDYNNDRVLYDKCGGSIYNPSNQRCGTGDVIEDQCGTDWYNTSTQYCKNGTTLTQYGSLEYAGQTYRTSQIGTQTWMAENLNYNAKGSRCFGEGGQVIVDWWGDGPEYTLLSNAEIQANCTKYGRLYDWATAMGIDARYNEEKWGGSDVKHRGICPSGWHIPSKAEWTAVSEEMWTYPLFSRGGGGHPEKNGIIFSNLDLGDWWSSSEYDIYAYSALVFVDGTSWYGNKSLLFRVRCVQD